MGVAPACGGITRSAIASWQTPAARAVPVGDGQQRRPPPTEAGYRLVVEAERLANPEADNGWMVLATTVRAEGCPDAEVLRAYQEQHTTVEPGFRWIKNPAAISPVWLEKPERIAALAMLTVLGFSCFTNLSGILGQFR